MSGADLPRAVLLDTCAVIWLANGDQLASVALDSIIHAGLADGVFVSPVSAWEIGLLSRSRPTRGDAVQFLPDPKTWFSRIMAGAAIKEAALTPEIAIDASFLPGEMHDDPADRMLIATARYLGVPVVTRDRKIKDYAQAGHVRVIAC